MSELALAERAMPQLTDDMMVADLVDVLEHLRFAGRQATTVRIDRGVRDYLLRMDADRSAEELDCMAGFAQYKPVPRLNVL